MTEEVTSEKEIRLLLRMRDDLQRRKQSLENELADLAAVLEKIDSAVVKDGFRKASTTPIQSVETDTVGGIMPIKSRDGTLLATVISQANGLQLTFSEGLGLTMDVPPFKSFLIDRVLAGMRSSDEERVSRGELGAGEVLSFDVTTDEKRLLGLTVRNFGESKRLREIMSSVRWTLERMYERLQTREVSEVEN